MGLLRDFVNSDKYNVFEQRNEQRNSIHYMNQVKTPTIYNGGEFKNPELERKKQQTILYIGLAFLAFLITQMNKR